MGLSTTRRRNRPSQPFPSVFGSFVWMIRILMAAGSNPSFLIDATINGPEPGMPVLKRMCPSLLANRNEDRPAVPT